ncbi:MAG TPA: maleylpyruvate isomerase N-terminal domain-containing protein [Ilumatobacteraceae bacterium]|nr:maleylpyruvate isomerase N-terminal domain-containing protein [Ilumatobacteraceae bacterium]
MGRHQREATVDCGEQYLVLHSECCRLVRSLSAEELAAQVPATPEWRVRDVFGHVGGLVADLNAGRLPGDEGPDAWGAAQVAARGALPIESVLEEWEREAPTFADGLRLFGYEWGSHFFADLLVHLHDVQAALGRSPHDEPLHLAIALDHYTAFIAEALAATPQWGSVVVRVGANAWTEEWPIGVGQVRVTIDGAAGEVLRCLCARRSVRQMGRVMTGDLNGFVEFLTGAWQVGYSVPSEDQL